MAQAKTKIQVGADPEVFLYNVKEKMIIPSCGLMGGDKGKGLQFNAFKLYQWLEDNVAVEFNFPPQGSAAAFGSTVDDVLISATAAMQAKLGAHFEFRVQPEAEFSIQNLTKNAKAMEIGCDPDMLAYDYPEVRRSPLTVDRLGTKRFAGGHLHLSFDNKHKIPGYALAMLCDVLIGLPALKADKQKGRREHYGLAGLYREKPYGIEYRTMSNWWMNSRYSDFRRSIMSNAFWLLEALTRCPEEVSDIFIKLPFSDIRECINKEDGKQMPVLYHDCTDLIGRSKLGGMLGYPPCSL